MRVYCWVLGVFLTGLLWAQTTNLVIQQVGIKETASSNLMPISLFLQQSLIGKSDRAALRLTSASPKDIALLQIKRLSSVVTLSVRESNQMVSVDVVFADHRGTNTLPSFAVFPLANWMQEIEAVKQRIHTEIARRYPPKPVTEVKTIDVVSPYSPYEIIGHEFSLGVSVGYVGRQAETGYRSGNNYLSTSRDVVGLSCELSFLWRHRLWHVMGSIHGFFPHDVSAVANLNVGYGLFWRDSDPFCGGNNRL